LNDADPDGDVLDFGNGLTAPRQTVRVRVLAPAGWLRYNAHFRVLRT
jgi:hypothetical protein